MDKIRYWHNVEQNSDQNSSKIPHSALKETKQRNFLAFQASMLDTLMSSVSLGGDSFNGSPLFNQSFNSPLNMGLNSPSSSSANALFGNLGGQSDDLEQRLINIQDQGMGKVLAAQFANRLPILGQEQGENAYKNSINGLDSLITLSIQVQIIKARKAIEDQFQSIA